MTSNLVKLEELLGKASGTDDRLDREIGAVLGNGGGRDAQPYTSSVDACIELIRGTLPEWHWHVGHGAVGTVPYASLTHEESGNTSTHVEATAPTVPLALLRVLVKALNGK